jgi:hypothetical protein
MDVGRTGNNLTCPAGMTVPFQQCCGSSPCIIFYPAPISTILYYKPIFQINDSEHKGSDCLFFCFFMISIVLNLKGEKLKIVTFLKIFQWCTSSEPEHRVTSPSPPKLRGFGSATLLLKG